MGVQTTSSPKLAWLNSLPNQKAKDELSRCCGASGWVERMMKFRPYRTESELFALADREWQKATEIEIREALSHHPKIGELSSLKTKFATTSEWASGEQSGVNAAPEQILLDLAQLNEEYFSKFGFIFIICATGKSAAEMLNALKIRLPNSPAIEIKNAAEEQRKITNLRLEKLVR